VTNELHRLTHPTPAQYRDQLRDGLKRCLREPACRKLFPALRKRAAATRAERPSVRNIANPGPRTGSNVRTPLRQRGTAPHRVRTIPDQIRPGPEPSPAQSSNPAPPPPEPPSLTVPAPVSICTDLLRVNCKPDHPVHPAHPIHP
jgi:hypothetical protein